MKYTPLGDLQQIYLGAQNAAFRKALRGYLFDGVPATTTVYATIANHLFVSGAIDKIGLEAAWLAAATEAERAVLFTRLCSGRRS